MVLLALANDDVEDVGAPGVAANPQRDIVLAELIDWTLQDERGWRYLELFLSTNLEEETCSRSVVRLRRSFVRFRFVHSTVDASEISLLTVFRHESVHSDGGAMLSGDNFSSLATTAGVVRFKRARDEAYLIDYVLPSHRSERFTRLLI